MLVLCQSPSYVVPPSPHTHLHIHVNLTSTNHTKKCRPKTTPPTSLRSLRCHPRLLILSWMSQPKSLSPSPKTVSRNTSPRLQTNQPRRLRRHHENAHHRRLMNMYWQIIQISQYVLYCCAQLPWAVFSFAIQRVSQLLRRAAVAHWTLRVQANSYSSL